MDSEHYKIFESIKNGSVISGKYNAKKQVFKKPKIVFVFANEYLRAAELTKDRWLILKISDDHEKLENVTKESV